MSIALTIFLGYVGLLILVSALAWWAYKRSKRNAPVTFVSYPHTVPPSRVDPEMIECSVDVIIVDKEGTMDIGFYNYYNCGWVTHDDFGEVPKKFVWMYRPSNFKL